MTPSEAEISLDLRCGQASSTLAMRETAGDHLLGQPLPSKPRDAPEARDAALAEAESYADAEGWIVRRAAVRAARRSAVTNAVTTG